MLLEQRKHPFSSMITLTYDEKHLPPDGGLLPSDLTKWLKRIRKELYPKKLRYYAVGEYGDENFRPHYHVALFGYPGCDLGRRFNSLSPCRCEACFLVQKTWSLGNTDVGHLNKESAQYVVQYVTKKMTKTNDPRLKGRYPEFARMSRRPGIGATAIDDIANVLTSDPGIVSLQLNSDVPSQLKHGGKNMPLGRYLKGKLRTHVGDEKIFKKESLQKYAQEMRLLSEETPPKTTFKKFLKEKNSQRILNMETRYRIYKQKGKL